MRASPIDFLGRNSFWKCKNIPCGFFELWKVDRVLGGTAGRRGIRRGGLHFFRSGRQVSYGR